MLTVQELRSSTDKELLQELAAARKNCLKTRVSVKTKHEKDIAKVEKAKRYVARILTVMKEIKKDGKADTEKKSAPEKETKVSK